MRFEWDEGKNRSNRVKHGVRFETATLVFADPYAITVHDRSVPNEERFRTIGVVGGVVLIVAHTERSENGRNDGEDVVRIISARKATPHERGRCEQSGGKEWR